jgi:azurin
MKIRLLSFTISAALLSFGCGKKESVPATVADVMSSAPSASTPTAASTGTPAATAATPAAGSTAAAAGKSAGDAKTSTAAKSADSKSSGGRVIEITANDQMKFSLATIEAKAGEELKVVLTNVGTLPKEAMGHNWVLLKAGTDPMAFGAASMTAKDTNYIGAAVKDQVIASTPILGPKQSADVTFKAPAPGEYTFICSFPGHVALMKGTLVVK